MGDVSGHGIAASFLTVTLNVMITNLTQYHVYPHDLLSQLNRDMCALFDRGDDPELYACVFYAVVDMRENLLHFSNAGLTLPLFVDAATGEASELEAGGMPIGLIRDAGYERKTATYRTGDLLFMYTDGLQDKFYKEQPDDFTRRLKDLLSELHLNVSLQEILDTVSQHFYVDNAQNHEMTNADDVSMLLCRL
jgi:sigma-B regulation protein RsbU (phosphoserine phosphatase)